MELCMMPFSCSKASLFIFPALKKEHFFRNLFYKVLRFFAIPLLTTFFLLGLFTPQIAIAAVSTSINVSRVGGVAPLAVFFDATNTTSSETNKPFHEINFEWDFGDPNSGNWEYGNLNNSDKNKAKGAVAAHVFEDPGTYVVTLNSTDIAGSTGTTTVTITVLDPNGVFNGTNTICFSSSGDFNGCPQGAELVTTSSASDIEGYISPGKRLLLRRGETWSNGSWDIYSDGPGTIGSFGTGNKPILNNINIDVAPGRPSVVGEPGTRDWRIMDLEFINTQERVISSEGEFQNLLLLRLYAHQTAAQSVFFPDSKLEYYNTNNNQQHEPHDGVFVVDCEMMDAPSYAVGRRYAVLGNKWDGGASTHVNRYPYIAKGVISHNYYERPGNQTIHLIKLHAPNWDGNSLFASGTESKEIIISDNHFHGKLENWSVALGPQSPQSYADEHVADVVVERNLFTAENGVTVCQLHTAGYNITVRNNVFNLSGAGNGAHAATAETRNAGQPPIFGYWFYNNNVFRDDGEAIGVSVDAYDYKIQNNIVYSPVNSNLGCSNNTDNCSTNLSNVNPIWNNPVSGDFTLGSGSPALNNGSIVPVFDSYYNYTNRLTDAIIDMGAYESESSSNSLIPGEPLNLRISLL